MRRRRSLSQSARPWSGDAACADRRCCLTSPASAYSTAIVRLCALRPRATRPKTGYTTPATPAAAVHGARGGQHRWRATNWVAPNANTIMTRAGRCCNCRPAAPFADATSFASLMEQVADAVKFRGPSIRSAGSRKSGTPQKRSVARRPTTREAYFRPKTASRTAVSMLSRFFRRTASGGVRFSNP